ncbi:MAG: TonB-dependent receptor, partial [Capnocytophaga sp.]
ANVYEGNHFDEYLWKETAGYSYKEPMGKNVYGNKKEGSAFAKLTWQVAPKLSLFGDVQYRYTHFKTFLEEVDFNETLSTLNPKAGLNYYFDPKNTIYFSFAHVTKEPNRNDYKNYALDRENGAEFPKHEKLNDLELGWRYDTDKVKLNTNLYYMLYKDQLVGTGDLNDKGYPIHRNSDGYRVGIEVDAKVRLSSKWQWAPNVSYSQNKNIDYKIKDPNHPNELLNLGNTQISFSPSWVAGNAFTFIPVENFQINLISKYVGEQYLSNENQDNAKLDSYLVHSLQLSYELFPKKVCKSILFTATGNNLLNKKYVPNARYKKNKPLYYPAAEANGIIGVTFSF